MKRIKVLYLDDSRLNQYFIKYIINQTKYSITVKAVNSPFDAISLLTKGNYDLIITDYKMPLLNGVQFIKRINELNSNTPIIVYSSFPNVKEFFKNLKNVVKIYKKEQAEECVEYIYNNFMPETLHALNESNL